MNTTSTPSNPAVWRDPRGVALLLAAALTTLANSTISPALPGLLQTFAADPNAALITRLLVPAPSLSVVFIAPLAGLLADRLGKRWMLLIGVALFILSGSAGLYLPDLDMIFLSRLVLGVAVAMIMTSQTALVGDYFNGDQRTALMALQISARNFGGFLFITLAGLIAASSARLPFALYATPLLFLPFLWQVVSEPVRERKDGSASIANSRPSRQNWLPMVLALSVLQMMTNLTFFVMPTQLPFFFVARGYEGAVMTGTALGALTLTGGLTALLYGRIKGRLGFAGAYAIGYGAMALGFMSLTLGTKAWMSFASTAAIGAGYSIAMPSFVAIAMSLAPAHRRGLVGGMLTTSVFIGQIASPLISTPLIAALDYDTAFRGFGLVLGLMALTALVIGLAGRRSRAIDPATPAIF